MNQRPTVTKHSTTAGQPRVASRRVVRNQAPVASNVTRLADRRPAQRKPAAAGVRTSVNDRFSDLLGRFLAFVERVFSGQSLLFMLTAAVAVILAIFGVIMVLSASSIQSIRETGGPFSYAWRQGLFAIIGVVFLMIASLIPVSTYMRFAGMFFAISCVLQAYAVFFGLNVNGNREWINLGPFTIQPGEFLKLAVILMMATHYQRFQGQEWNYKIYGWRSLIYVAIGAFLIIIGNDMGTTMVLGMIALLVLWLSEVPGIAMRIPVGLALLAVLYGLWGSASRRARIDAWLNPGTDDQANNLVWQSMHGVWALANSNGIGRGLGMSNLKWSWIPEVQNDYIFAIIGEELGFAGAVLTVLLFGLLGYLILQIALRARDLFSRMVCYGVAGWFVIQAVINIAVVLTLLPVLGVPLPLVSYGGSSLITGLAAVGVVLSIERRNHEELDGGSRGRLRARR